jgi:hypothetical protein
MLQITIPATEMWDESKQEFISTKEQTLQLEHSLVSLSKWESKWCKAFLSKKDKSIEETLDYIKCMTLTQNVSPDVYKRLTPGNIEEINKYIEAPMTATVFSDEPKGSGGRKTITAEVIYHWMIALGIWPECQKWHLNRLLALIRTCEVMNSPPKKRSKRDIMSRNAALNAARRKQLNSRG